VADDLSIVDDDGVVRFLGNIPGPVRYGWTPYGETPKAPLIPRSQWKPVDLDAFVSPVKDQDGIGACNAFATCNAAEACRRQAGLPDVRLSPGYLYGSINGQRDQGSMLEDALRWMVEHGTCTEATVGALAWRRPQWRDAQRIEQERSLYRFLEAYWCPSFDHLASAVQMGFFLDLGIMWCANFRPDADGWLPEAGRGQQGGHAILGKGLFERGGKWGLGMVNSWGRAWGANGRAVIPEPHFRTGLVGGWWAVRSVVTESTDVPAPQFP
jgi:hypothetical protein